MRGLFHIPPRHAFVDALARGLLDAYGADTLAFADALVLLPNRRAVRALRDAFLRATDGRPLLLPRIRPIGDIDDDELAAAAVPALGEDAMRIEDLPPAVSTERREALLARLVLEHGPSLAGIEAASFSPAQALRLARELASLLDELQIASVPLDALAGLVADEHADHWRGTLEFLGILRKRWPAELARLGAMDPVERRSKALRAQAAHWRAQPPTHAVIAAGSTGTQPATRELLAAIAELPLGCVVAAGHALAGRDQVSFKDVAGWPLAVQSHALAIRRYLERRHAWLLQEARPPLVTNSLQLVKSLVRSGSHVALTSELDAGPEILEGSVRFVPLSDRSAQPQTIGVAVSASRPLPRIGRIVADLLAEHLQDYLAQVRSAGR